jgi:ATP-dependent DNA ligase
MKAVLTDQPFSDPGWVFERKLDGVRCGAIRTGGTVRLLSRSGQDMTRSYPELVEALEVDGPDLILDGEIVAFEKGRTSFERLQRRMQIHDPARARQSGVAVYYYLFDLLEFEVATCGGCRYANASRCCARRWSFAADCALPHTAAGTGRRYSSRPVALAGRA